MTGNQDYRDIGQRLGFVDRAIFVSTSKNFQLYRAGATAGGLDRDQIAHARNYIEVLALLRGTILARVTSS